MKYIKKFLKHHKQLRKIARRVFSKGKSIIYKTVYCNAEIDDKKIMFETFMGRQYGCNPRAIYEYMIRDERFSDYTFVWAFKDVSKKNMFKELQHANVVEYKSKEYFKCCASAGYVITNSNMEYMIQKRKGQTFLQTWHGTPLKKLRCDIIAESGNANNTLDEIKTKNDMDVVRYDYFISPSEFATDKFKSAFNLQKLKKEQILIETGYPRNDILYNYTEDDKRRIIKKLGIEDNKKVILYAPTFRDNQHEAGEGYVYELGINFDKLRKELKDEYVILFRTHYFIANSFDFSKYENFIYDVSQLDDIAELYLISDILITDYSSVFFDFANLKKPMIFYMYDKDEYANDIRGFYVELDELPGDIVTEEEDLINRIKNISSWHVDEKYLSFNSKYNYLDDGNSSKRVVEIVLGNKG